MEQSEFAIPKVLGDFLDAGKEGFEDDSGAWWDLEIESSSELPRLIREALPGGAMIIGNNRVGDLIFLIPNTDGRSLGDRVFIYRHEGPEIEEMRPGLGKLLKPGRREPSDHATVTYHGSGEPVRLGDRVEIRLWILFRRQGEVIYVPGISRRKPSMERDGLAWVGIRLDSGGEVATVILPDTNQLERTVKRLEPVGD